jgi:hypothetical protein
MLHATMLPLGFSPIIHPTEHAASPGIQQGSWESFTAPGANADRLCHGTVYDHDNDKIYMIGGTPNGYGSSLRREIYRYDPATDTWTTSLALMSTARGWIQGAYWNGKIYVMGGMNTNTQAISSCEVYDIASNAWSAIASLPQAQCCHGTVAHDGNIYVVGGTNLYTGYASVYRYNIASNSWTSCTSLPEAWDMGGCAIWGDVIYLCGGYNRNDTLTYDHIWSGTISNSDPDQITWTQGTALEFPTGNCGATALGGYIFILGGFDETTRVVTDKFFAYSISTGLLVQLVLYIVAIARCHYLVGRQGHNSVYAVAGDASGNWSPPNNYYQKIDDPVGLAEGNAVITSPATELSVVPNIGNDVFVITAKSDTPQRISLTLYNTLGQEIMPLYQGTTGQCVSTLSASTLSAGVYFIRLVTEHGAVTEKLIVTVR